MKVAINSLPLGSGHKTRGIGFYTRNLLSALKQSGAVTIEEFSKLSDVKDADLIHYPYFDLFQKSLPGRFSVPAVVTIHDIIPLLYPKAYPPGIRGRLNLYFQKRALKNTAAVITDSESSRQDIIRCFNYPTEKVFTVYLAPSNHFKTIEDNNVMHNVSSKYKLPEKYVLFIGSTNWNKNLLNMAEGCIKAGVDLVLAGKSFEDKDNLDHPEKRSFRQFLQKYSEHHLIHILGFIEDDDLAAITNIAKAVLLPSFAEGFGLPILEAQVCGTPVITSNISSMPEVAGEGAILVDPYSVEEIATAVKNITEDNKLHRDLQEKGYKNVSKYSWEKTAKETVKVYEKILSK